MFFDALLPGAQIQAGGAGAVLAGAAAVTATAAGALTTGAGFQGALTISSSATSSFAVRTYRPAQLRLSVQKASSDGLFWPRYPQGNKPAFMTAQAPIGSSVAGALSTASRLAGAASASVAGSGALTSGAVVNRVGLSLAGVSNSSPNQPFLNIFHTGDDGAGNGWATGNSSSFETNENGYLQLDADGYPTSLVAHPTPPGGQQFTFVFVFCNYSLPTPAGASHPYEPGTYRIKWDGAGTIQLGLDASGTYTTSPANVTISAPNAGIALTITQTDPLGTGNYIRNISIVNTLHTAAFDAGEIFHPQFLANLAYFDRLRMMDWMNVANELKTLSLTGSPAAGATSATLSAIWTRQGGSYVVLFNSGETRVVTFTAGSAAINWSSSGALTVNTGSSNIYMTYRRAYDWAHQPQSTAALYTTPDGVPISVQVALCNRTGKNLWLNIPSQADNAWVTSCATYVRDNLNSPQKVYVEYSNEVWNYGQTQGLWCQLVGFFNFGNVSDYNTTRLCQNGRRVAEIADIFASVFGNPAFDNRVIIGLGAQAANTESATIAAGSSLWVAQGATAPYLRTSASGQKTIKAWHIAPYFANWYSNDAATQTDLATMTAVTTPLDDLFATFTSQTGTVANGAKNYSASVPAGGWFNQALGWISSYASILSSWGSPTLEAYESGQGLTPYPHYTDGSPVQLLFASANRDARMGTYYSAYYAQWKSRGGNIMNAFVDCTTYNTYGEWGLYESLMQTFSPLSSAPVKWQATINYINGN